MNHGWLQTVSFAVLASWSGSALLSAFLSIRNSLARLLKSGTGTASFRLLRLLLLLPPLMLSFVRESSTRDLMGFWTLFFRAPSPPASSVFHHARLLETVTNADDCAQHPSGWESVSWCTTVLKTSEGNGNGAQLSTELPVHFCVERREPGRGEDMLINELTREKERMLPPLQPAHGTPPCLQPAQPHSLRGILKGTKNCSIVRLFCLPLCFVALIIDADRCLQTPSSLNDEICSAKHAVRFLI